MNCSDARMRSTNDATSSGCPANAARTTSAIRGWSASRSGRLTTLSATGGDGNGLVDVQLVEKRERVIDRLEEILVLDHLAAHVDAEPLLVAIERVATEHVRPVQQPSYQHIDDVMPEWSYTESCWSKA